MQKAPAYRKYKKEEAENKNKKLKLQRKRAKEKRKRVTRCESPSPSPIREPERRASNWSSDLSKSSNVRQLRSFQIHHIKHNETKFQMLDKCFPNQFHQLKGKSDTVHEGTHEIPKIRKTKHHS